MRRIWLWPGAGASGAPCAAASPRRSGRSTKSCSRSSNLGLDGPRLTSKVGLLSGGQRQALTLLMATLQKPKVLLLDERTAALDPKTAAEVPDATDRIVTRDALTTIMITHNMRDAIVHGNRLIMMNEGQIILDIRGEAEAASPWKICSTSLKRSAARSLPPTRPFWARAISCATS